MSLRRTWLAGTVGEAGRCADTVRDGQQPGKLISRKVCQLDATVRVSFDRAAKALHRVPYCGIGVPCGLREKEGSHRPFVQEPLMKQYLENLVVGNATVDADFAVQHSILQNRFQL